MNPKRIEEARTAELRAVEPALRRAARRAREIAIATGTRLVVAQDGGWAAVAPSEVPEPPASTGG